MSKAGQKPSPTSGAYPARSTASSAAHHSSGGCACPPLAQTFLALVLGPQPHGAEKRFQADGITRALRGVLGLAMACIRGVLSQAMACIIHWATRARKLQQQQAVWSAAGGAAADLGIPSPAAAGSSVRTAVAYSYSFQAIVARPYDRPYECVQIGRAVALLE